MTRRSLRLRLIVAGILAILAALMMSGAALVLLFERHVARTMTDDLDVYLGQLIAGLDADGRGVLSVQNPPADPRFEIPLSGLYWQIGEEGRYLLRSRSLWDVTLALRPDEPSPGQIHHHALPGPADSRVLVSERVVFLNIAGRSTRIRVAVAADVKRLSMAQAAFTTDLAIALGLLGLVLAAATSIQVALGLRPLDRLREEISNIRAGISRRLANATAPSEVAPLVDEVNALLDAQDAAIERSRGRAADLAHGLKTPLAALSADAARLRDKGEDTLASNIEQVADQMRRHVERELARARTRGTLGRAAQDVTSVLPLVRTLVEIHARTVPDRRMRFEVDVADGAVLPFDRTDLAEILGNLLDNAMRHARSRIRITAGSGRTNTGLTIEDDGPGIAPSARAAATERGRRLDERGGSAGLGLAIVQDVLDAYGWTLNLSGSELGGLRAAIAPQPATPPDVGMNTLLPT